MNQFEQYKRLIKLGFALILVALLTGLYGVIWINWYNKIIWAPFFRRGNLQPVQVHTENTSASASSASGRVSDSGESSVFDI